MRNQGVQTIETGAYNHFLLPPITELLKSGKSQIILCKNLQQKFKLRSIDSKPTISFKQEQIKENRKNKELVLHQLHLPLIKPELQIAKSKIKEQIFSTNRLIDNIQLISCVSRARNLSYNDQINNTERLHQFSIRGTQSQIQSRILA
ncbi:unnamed protein product (macronuclear) [Paramecium tetraurelia]|uniref:Uncharacterized protein n=1 Tax=Paramecium tetraurelia TaxID=5888 RepID=A0DPZ4_PARTE|nr:uncharacterized protein GSPATT00002510001 [Paramecium tetraurelia]CAK85111.1 unnamed protein product [Paramecium tetraurelia]|eukprot:XP_001452508.1 hypothetical protein (macronuclear) [Paramecium tetraurelia strain d4-2]